MTREPYNILFLCTGNSSRSIMAEAILNRIGEGRFRAYSAGSLPRGCLDPETVTLLRDRDHDLSGLRSKFWAEFARPEAPKMRVIVTLCDTSAGEACAELPGGPHLVGWLIPDPAAITADLSEKRRRLAEIYAVLEAHIRIFVDLWEKTLDSEPAESFLPGAKPLPLDL